MNNGHLFSMLGSRPVLKFTQPPFEGKAEKNIFVFYCLWAGVTSDPLVVLASYPLRLS